MALWKHSRLILGQGSRNSRIVQKTLQCHQQEGDVRKGCSLWSRGWRHRHLVQPTGQLQPTGPCPQMIFWHHYEMYSSFLFLLILLYFDSSSSYQVNCHFNAKLSKILPALVLLQNWEPRPPWCSFPALRCSASCKPPSWPVCKLRVSTKGINSLLTRDFFRSIWNTRAANLSHCHYLPSHHQGDQKSHKKLSPTLKKVNRSSSVGQKHLLGSITPVMYVTQPAPDSLNNLGRLIKLSLLSPHHRVCLMEVGGVGGRREAKKKIC